MQEFIKWLEEVIEISESKRLNSQIIETLDYVLLAAESKLEKEKQQIIKAFDEGQEYEYQYHINSAPKFDSETYYTETYEK